MMLDGGSRDYSQMWEDLMNPEDNVLSRQQDASTADLTETVSSIRPAQQETSEPEVDELS